MRRGRRSVGFRLGTITGVCLAALIAGCASITPTSLSRPQQKAGRSIAVGAEGRAQVGDPILAEFSYMAQPGMVTRENFAMSIGFASVRIAAGALLVQAEVGGSPAYCTVQPAYFVVGEARSVCLFDTRGQGRFELLYVVGTISSIRYTVDIPYSSGEVVAGSDGFKYELIYEGRDRDSIRLSYREFLRDLARPAFQQEVVYTLNPQGATQVSFKSVRLEILAADNNGLRYRLLHGFTDAADTKGAAAGS